MAAMSIFPIVNIAPCARAAAAVSSDENSSIIRRGTICQDTPNRSVSQPHRLSSPPSAVSAAQSRSVSA